MSAGNSRQDRQVKEEAPARDDSLERRYLYKLAANIFSLLANLAVQAMVPRALGPRSYGDFSFLSSTFTQLFGFFDMGTSTCFYAKLSQRPRDDRLILFYFYFAGVAAVAALGIVAASDCLDAFAFIFPGQQVTFIYMALAWGVLYFLAAIIDKIGDACGLTVPVERLRILQRAIGVMIILILFSLDRLDLSSFFGYYYAIFILFIGAVTWLLKRDGYFIRPPLVMGSGEIKNYSREFYLYSHPLFVFSLVGLITDFLDRWLLQIYGGGIQQGFFGLSYQIGAICLLVTGAMVPLLTREFAIAFKERENSRIAYLFERYVPVFCALATYFSCFVAAQYENVTFLMGGRQYASAAVAVAIMAYFPIFQAYGQLTGAVFYAMGLTKLYRNIGIACMILGLPLTYFLVAPAENLGIDAGATGLSVKVVAACFVGVNIQLYFVTKILQLNFGRFLGSQIRTILIFSAISFASVVLVQNVLTGGGSQHLSIFVLSGMLYTTVIIAVVALKPSLIGVSRRDISGLYGLITKRNG